jgi:hypothetical protein
MNEAGIPVGATEREISIRRRVHRFAEFYQHLFVFVIVIGLLWLLNAFVVYNEARTIKWSSWWAVWPTFGWGIGLLVHGLTLLPLGGFFSQDWEDRKVKELMSREPRQ